MSDENNYTIWGFLKKLFEKEKIYRDVDVVPWSGRSGTSYSQMEVIEGRKLVAHRSVFVRFPLKEKKDEFLLVWTTTPWTIPGNRALAYGKDIDYSLITIDEVTENSLAQIKDKLIIAKELLDIVTKSTLFLCFIKQMYSLVDSCMTLTTFDALPIEIGRTPVTLGSRVPP